ncbi:MAG: hypothetical protein JRG91_18480, partial [Deltaproteobacteria bacterium]|nr:hypothetical protein [Deltaproteobacteria bacterium]
MELPRSLLIGLTGVFCLSCGGGGGPGADGNVDGSGDPDAEVSDVIPEVDPDSVPDECLEGTGGLSLHANIETMGVV